jgi:3-deoxy-7-phosphoheptulonate synthase
MIISMRRGATKEQVEHICKRIEDLEFRVHSIQGEERVVIAAVGTGDVTHAIESLASSPEVESAVKISAPYKLVSRQVKKERTVVTVANGGSFGGDEFGVVAGPCSVETADQIMSSAEQVAKSGAKFLRGGAYKPRSSPYSFQGLEEKGLKLLRKAGDATGLAVVTEVMTVTNVDLVAEYADVLQIGARNIQNFPLLKEVGRVNRPIVLKRGLCATLEELLLSAEYILSHGNPNVVLCERGIRTFETATRNTLDIQAVPVLRQMTHLPIVLDPAHSSGMRSIIPALTRATAAVGADGMMLEIHPDPEKAWSDGAQSLTFDAYAKMMDELQPYVDLWKKERAREQD